MPRRRRPVSLFAVVTMIIVSLACGGGGSDLPDGWESFSEGPFKGGAHEDWITTYADLDDFDLSTLPEGIPDSFRESLANLQASGEITRVFLLFLDTDPTFATNVNILPCEAASSVDLIDSTDEIVQLYARKGTDARPAGTVSYNGSDFDLIQLFIVEEFDSYQVYLETDDCYTAATLTTRAGDQAQIESFRQFLEHLEIDADGLR